MDQDELRLLKDIHNMLANEDDEGYATHFTADTVTFQKLRVSERTNLNSARLPFAPSRRAIQMTAEACHVPVLLDGSMPRLPWLYSHGLAILAAARAAPGAQSPTRIHSKGLPHGHR